MDYQKIHDKIILNARTRIRENKYYECHHIIPKCMGGTDSENNLVYLEAKEHFIVHYILTKIYPKNRKLIFAWMAMSFMKSPKSKRVIRPNSRLYKLARERASKEMKDLHTGRVVSEETRKLISNKLTGKLKSKEHCQNLSKSMTGRILSEDHKKLISFNSKNRSAESLKRTSDSLIGNKRACGQIISESHRKVLREIMTGRVVSEETRKRMSSWQIGKKLSDDTKRKISETKKLNSFIEKANK